MYIKKRTYIIKNREIFKLVFIIDLLKREQKEIFLTIKYTI